MSRREKRGQIYFPKNKSVPFFVVAQPNGWDQMVERQRASEDDGLCLGLDAANLAEAFSAGNAVVAQVAEWIGRGLMGE
ncbi:hypothetical protein [Pseudomonas gingeri]|uniref:hypothetical protein n=1 Tax=Pseudomonas gingeri TaxID=117681 RepID=UPI00210C2B08|nr:hypothetical protein [Pseudomonas gingeri]